MKHLASAPGFAAASIADVVLADSHLGQLVHHAVRRGQMHYTGHEWLITSPRVPGSYLEPSWEPIVWLREWLTQGVIELIPPARRWPDPLDSMPRELTFTGQWADAAYAHAHNLWNCNCRRTENVR